MSLTPQLQTGAEIGNYMIQRRLGRGGMGVVYRARHVALDQPRALKLIAPALAADPDFRARFEREARLAASVDSEHVVTVHHAGVDDGRLFLSMRLVRGRDLGSLVEADGPLTPVAAAAILDQIEQLGDIRDYFPTAEEYAWTDLLQTPIDSGDLYRGVIQSLVYSAIFTALAFRHFARRDVTS